MSTNASQSQVQNVSGDYRGRVTLISTILTGDRPVIFTRITLEDGKHVTHAVRLKGDDPVKTAAAIRIGLNDLRTGFPNKLALLSDRDLILAMKDEVILNDEVIASIVPQMKNNLPVKLENGQNAYNVKLRPATKMENTVATSLIDSLLAPTTSAATDPFAETSN